jgi:putative flippase GtrA
VNLVKNLIANVLQMRFARFFLTGGINTLVTYILYLGLLKVLDYRLSYTLAYLGGIVMSFFLNKIFVFKQHRGRRSVLLFPFVYLIQYAFGLLVLWLLVQQLGVRPEWGPLIVVVLSIPMTYLLTRLVFVGSDGATGAGDGKN